MRDAGSEDAAGRRNGRCFGFAMTLALVVGLGAASGTAKADDLIPLSDEFDSASSLAGWQRVSFVEGWNADQLEVLDVDTLAPGALRLVPYTSTWYQDWRGVLLFKNVAGDFIVTTRVRTTGRSAAIPQASFSLAGLMIREPRAITPATWTPGGENYVFLSHGSASVPGTRQLEVKTTLDSVSALEILPISAGEVRLRVARLGEHVVLLVQIPGEEWVVERRFRRHDFSTTVQVGLTVYTDWSAASQVDPALHNASVFDAQFCADQLLACDPDLVADFAYVRFQRPMVPESLVGADLGDPATVSDAELLSFLGVGAEGPIFDDGFESGSLSAWTGGG